MKTGEPSGVANLGGFLAYWEKIKEKRNKETNIINNMNYKQFCIFCILSGVGIIIGIIIMACMANK